MLSLFLKMSVRSCTDERVNNSINNWRERAEGFERLLYVASATVSGKGINERETNAGARERACVSKGEAFVYPHPQL